MIAPNTLPKFMFYRHGDGDYSVWSKDSQGDWDRVAIIYGEKLADLMPSDAVEFVNSEGSLPIHTDLVVDFSRDIAFQDFRRKAK